MRAVLYAVQAENVECFNLNVDFDLYIFAYSSVVDFENKGYIKCFSIELISIHMILNIHSKTIFSYIHRSY